MALIGGSLAIAKDLIAVDSDASTPSGNGLVQQSEENQGAGGSDKTDKEE